MQADRARAFASIFVDGLRVTFLRKPRGNVAGPGPLTFVGATAVYLALEALGAWVDAGTPRMFVGYGVETVLADALLTLGAAAILTRMLGRDGTTWGVAAILVAATALTALLVHWPLQLAVETAYAAGHFRVAAAFGWLSLAWWLFVLVVYARRLAPQRTAGAIAAAMLAFLVSAVTWWWLPGTPIFVEDTRAAAAQRAEGDAIDEADDDYGFDAERVMHDQPRLLAQAVAALTPRTPGIANVHVLAFAGDASENVFRNEVEYVERLFAGRFDAGGRTLVLVNNPATLATRPLATLTNLRIALDMMAERMDAAEDILFVYLTSHGAADHELYVNLDPLPLNQITPEDLADALDTSPPIRWKVIVVNACYAGGFIDALRGDSTLVIAAARSDRTSFGCGSESDITFFGKAFLAEALNETTSIPQAFERARVRIAEWEAADDAIQEHSEPQIAGSAAIEAILERWSSALAPRPPIPFTPAAGESRPVEAEPAPRAD